MVGKIISEQIFFGSEMGNTSSKKCLLDGLLPELRGKILDVSLPRSLRTFQDLGWITSQEYQQRVYRLFKASLAGKLVRDPSFCPYADYTIAYSFLNSSTEQFLKRFRELRDENPSYRCREQSLLVVECIYSCALPEYIDTYILKAFQRLLYLYEKTRDHSVREALKRLQRVNVSLGHSRVLL